MGTDAMKERNCLMTAWNAHQDELRGWLRQRTPSAAEADDLLQDLFVKALRQGPRFCQLQNARAWLFEVARNALTDRFRVHRDTVDLPENLTQDVSEVDTVDTLTACLPRVLSELAGADRDAIIACDLQGMSQADFATSQGLSLSAAKSRLQRARTRLKLRMSLACQVRLDEAGRVADFVPRPPL